MMYKVSFYDGSLNRAVLKRKVQETEKPILFTYGYEYRHPTIHRKPISVDEAMRIIEKEFYLDAEETRECIHLNAFSDNDMF